MNFLAHLLLAGPDPLERVGSVMADFVKGRLDPALPAALRRGIEVHRRVDAFTDTHPLVGRSVGRISPRWGRYAPILVDLFYDHLLARDWPRYGPPPLGAFVDGCYATLADHHAVMPADMRRAVTHMRDHDWLRSYASDEGMGRVLGMLSVRLSIRLERAVDLAPAVADLQAHRDGLDEDFAAFFPQVAAVAAA